jgi:hypothetical protein
MAVVDFFVLAKLQGTTELRFGVANLSTLHRVKSEVGAYWKADLGLPKFTRYGVRLCDMVGKMVMVIPSQQSGVAHFLEYGLMSGGDRTTFDGEEDVEECE